MGGGGFLDWDQVAAVLAVYGIPFHPSIHRKLRVCIYEALRIEKEQADKEKKSKGKRRH